MSEPIMLTLDASCNTMNDPTTPTPDAAKFMKANKKHLVIAGDVMMHDGTVYYRLENGATYTLTSEDCRSMPMPVWKLK